MLTVTKRPSLKNTGIKCDCATIDQYWGLIDTSLWFLTSCVNKQGIGQRCMDIAKQSCRNFEESINVQERKLI